MELVCKERMVLCRMMRWGLREGQRAKGIGKVVKRPASMGEAGSGREFG